MDAHLPQLMTWIGASGIALVFVLLHLLTGLFMPAKPPFLWHLVERAGEEIDRRLNKPERGMRALFYRGLGVAAVMAVFGLLIGAAFENIRRYDYGWIAVLALLFMTVNLMGLLRVMQQVAGKLEAGDAKAAAQILQPFVKDDVAGADTHTLARRAIETSAISLNNFFIAPLFWFVLFKTPGLAVYVMTLALYDAYGSNDSKHMMFGGIIRGLERALDYIPARITALLIIVASLFVSRANPARGLSIAMGQARQYRSVNRGWLVAAMAGGLGVTLGGPLRHRRGYTLEHGWIGPAKSSAKVTSADVRRAAMLHFVVLLCSIVALSLAVYLLGYMA